MADTPTPTAQDWESLRFRRTRADAYRMDAGDWTFLAYRIPAPTDRWFVGFDDGSDYGCYYDSGPLDSEHEAFTICAALVLLAAGVLSAGAQQQ